MSQTAIGRAALVLTTNASGVRPGLDQAGRDARQWADGTAKQIDAKLKPAGKSAGAGLVAALVRISAPATSVVKSLAQVPSSAAVAVTGIGTVTAAMSTLDDLAKQGAAAKAFGLTAEQFTSISGLAKSVGGDTRELVESLVTLQKLGTEGAAGKGEVAVQFFKDLNVSAAEFNALRLDEQFYKVFESIKGLRTEGEQVRALMTAFGEDGGKNLLPLLSKSGAEIRQLAKGFAISGQQVQAATRAQESFQRAQQSIANLWRRIAVAAAPVLEFMAKELTHTIDQFSKMENVAVPALSKVLRLTASLADATRAVTAATLIATGVRLKLIQAEITARLAYQGAVAGGPAGFVAGLAAGGAAATALEVTIGPEIREAGGVLLELGKGMLADVGGATKRAEQFIVELERRKGQPPDAGGGPVVPKAVTVDLTKNPALLKGSKDEVTARMKYETGAKDAADKALAEAQKGNGILGEILGAAKAIAEKPAPAGLLPM